MKKIGILLLIIISFSFTKDENDILYQNYAKAINNNGTFQFFLVIKIKNLNTNETREICTTGDFLQGAIHHEYNIPYDEDGLFKVSQISLKNKKRYFEFKNELAIANLGVKDYSANDLNELESKINFNLLAEKIKKTKKWSSYLDEKDLIIYAHALFKRGILTGENNCMGGKLIYISPETQF